QGTRSSFGGAISADGRYVAFASTASNLVPDDTNGDATHSENDVFVHDLRSGRTQRVSVSSDGAQANGNSGPTSLSADGRYVAFGSNAPNLVAGDTNNAQDVFVHDNLSSETQRLSRSSPGGQRHHGRYGRPRSADGRDRGSSSYATTP